MSAVYVVCEPKMFQEVNYRVFFRKNSLKFETVTKANTLVILICISMSEIYGVTKNRSYVFTLIYSNIVLLYV